MMYRFNRDYELKLQFDGREFTITPDIRITFDACKSISGGLNKCNLEIYNLNPEKRRALIKEAEDFKPIPLQLKVGYKGSLILLFQGSVHTSNTKRSGTDYVTKIECLDGGYAYHTSHTSMTVTKRKEAIETLLNDMQGISLGSIPELEEFSRPVVMSGSTFDIINELLNKDETYFIENEKLYIVKGKETIGVPVPLVSPETGLLNTPERKSKLVTFNTVINPIIKTGGRVKLESTTAEYLNGIYRINTSQYKGDFTGSDWIQTCECMAI